ncbi:MAG TPA: hypothetical protein VM843_08965, partial [Flavisolibacter sp.]|nr:hypothetical protein [Flavisolibacter sp.]
TGFAEVAFWALAANISKEAANKVKSLFIVTRLKMENRRKDSRCRFLQASIVPEGGNNLLLNNILT